MTETPLCSVLLPTRGRHKQAREVIDAMIDKWSVTTDIDISDLEIIVRVNPDKWETDVEMAEIFLNKWDYAGLKFILLVDKLRGYRYFHQYYNQMAPLATGKWIFMQSDDGFIRTEGWGDALSSLPINPELEIALLQPECNGEPNCFPIISRAWYNQLGHIAHHVSVDGYLERIGRALDCMYPVNIYIRHEKHELTGIPCDETRKERDIFLAEFIKNTDTNQVTAPRYQVMIENDARILRAYMKNASSGHQQGV